MDFWQRSEKIEFDEPISKEEAIRKIKHCYEQSKHRYETKQGWKGNEKNKGKQDKKKIIPQDKGNKENETKPNKFNAFDRGQGFQFEEKNKSDRRKYLQCWTHGKDHHQSYYA